MTLTDALVAVGLAESRNSARRTLAEGAVSLNGDKVVDGERTLEDDDFIHGRVAVLKRGRKAQFAAQRAR